MDQCSEEADQPLSPGDVVKMFVHYLFVADLADKESVARLTRWKKYVHF